MPDIPTASEAGLPGYEVISWGGIFAPAGTPAAIVTKLNGEMNAALQTADLKERYSRIAVEPAGGPPQVLAKLVASEVRKWSKVIEDANIPKE
jgi:tripartite-type tricarboxylate transporter receptor subunit TctC